MARSRPPSNAIGLAVVLALTVALAAWRGWLVSLGWDPDSDSYGHHSIARHLVTHPWDHQAHWVWLPLFHWGQAVAVWLGATFDHVRWFNVVVWAGVPPLLYWHLTTPVHRSPTQPVAEPATAALAATLTGLCPIGMEMGTTAQTESSFGLLLLAYAVAMERRRFMPATLILTACVLLRYESWAVLVASTGWLGLRAIRRRSLRYDEGGAWWHWGVVVAPTLAIVLWAWLRLPADGGRWFGFISETSKFAHGVHKVDNAFEAGTALPDTFYYAHHVARKVLGVAVYLVPLGLPALLLRRPWLVVSGGAALGFVTLSWLNRSSLQLDRHFVAVIPLYAASAALGARWAANRLIDIEQTAAGRPWGELARRSVFLVIAVLCVVPLTMSLRGWMRNWQGAIVGGYPDRRAVARHLRSLPPGEPIYCDEGTVEIMSRLPRERFHQRPVDWPATRRAALADAKRAGAVHVVSWWSKLKAVRKIGVVTYRPPKAGKWGLAVVRISRDDAQTTDR